MKYNFKRWADTAQDGREMNDWDLSRKPVALRLRPGITAFAFGNVENMRSENVVRDGWPYSLTGNPLGIEDQTAKAVDMARTLQATPGNAGPPLVVMAFENAPHFDPDVLLTMAQDRLRERTTLVSGLKGFIPRFG